MREDCPEIRWQRGIDLVGDEETYYELLSDYRKITQGYLDVIQNAIANEDHNTVLIRSHGIKGSSGNLAMPLVSSAAADLEHAARDNRYAEFPQLFAQLESSFLRVCEILANTMPPKE